MALGTIMGVVAWVVERRMVKVLKRRGEEPQAGGNPGVELSTTPEQVDDQTDR